MNRLDNLRDAFPAMPEECRSALSTAARSVKEEETMKHKFPIAILIAAILLMMTTATIAESWNALGFLGIGPDSEAQQLVQPMSLSASASNVTLNIESAITDGQYLAFSWSATNADPSKPAFLTVESFTANGKWNLYNISNTTFDDRWLPGFSGDASLQGGWIAQLSPWMQENDTLHIELTVAVHTAVKPAYFLDAYRTEEALAALNDGYVVIIGDDRFAMPSDPNGPGYITYVDGLFKGGAVHGTERSTMTLSFDLNMKAAMATSAAIDQPITVSNENAALTLEHFTVTPLQVVIKAVATWSKDNPPGLSGKFILRDKAGNSLKIRDLSASKESFTESIDHKDMEGVKHTDWSCCLIDPVLPDELTLVLKMSNGTELSIPLK